VPSLQSSSAGSGTAGANATITATATPEPKSDTGLIAGIAVVAVIAGLALVASLAFLLLWRKAVSGRKSAEQEAHPQQGADKKAQMQQGQGQGHYSEPVYHETAPSPYGYKPAVQPTYVRGELGGDDGVRELS